MNSEQQIGDKLESLLRLFAIKRLLAIETNPAGVEACLSVLRQFAGKRNLEYEVLDGRTLTSGQVRGVREIVRVEGQPFSRRNKPAYWPKGPKLIAVTGIDEETDTEVLRAFLHVACIGEPLDRSGLPEDKLPDGSGFVFVSTGHFPAESCDAITGYWKDESRILTL
jgi:hypothetical protein